MGRDYRQASAKVHSHHAKYGDSKFALEVSLGSHFACSAALLKFKAFDQHGTSVRKPIRFAGRVPSWYPQSNYFKMVWRCRERNPMVKPEAGLATRISRITIYQPMRARCPTNALEAILFQRSLKPRQRIVVTKRE